MTLEGTLAIPSADGAPTGIAVAPSSVVASITVALGQSIWQGQQQAVAQP